MDRFFLFCFRSCLKGDNDKEYYEVLEINDPSQATAEVVKRQYKKLSLTLHPDKLSQKGIEVTHEHKHRFLKLKEAYDVLSDPKRKKIYDEYGLSGLKLLENPTEINHLDLLRNFQKNRGDRTTLALFIALIFAALLLLPILFALKCDGTLGTEAPWVAIWSPMWFADIFLFLSAIAVLLDKGESDEHDDEQDGEQQEENKKANKIPLHEKIYQFVITILFFLIQIFVLIRLDKYTEWAWFSVFIPWFIYEGVNIVYHLHGAFFVTIVPPNNENVPFNTEEGAEGIEEQFMNKIKADMKYFEEVLERDRCQKAVLAFALRFWQAIFLALQLDNLVDWNWGLVFLPIWIHLFTQYIYVYIFRSWGASKMEGLDIERIMAQDVTDPSEISRFQQGTTLQSQASVLCWGQIVVIFMAIMLVCRLQEASYSVFFIILPVFLFLGTCCCIVFCGITCLSIVDTEGLEEEIQKQQGGSGRGGGDADGSADVEGGEGGDNGNVPIVVSSEYGTFPDKDSVESYKSYKSPLQTTVEVTSVVLEESNEPAKAEEKKLAAATTIDPDID